MQSTTLPVLTNMAPVTKALLEQGGFKVDMQSMDWQTVVSRRAKKDPADKGGWSAFHTYAIAADILNPIAANFTVANGDKAWFGWPDDPEMEKLRDAYSKETDRPKPRPWRQRRRTAPETAQYASSASGTGRRRAQRRRRRLGAGRLWNTPRPTD
jgi:peptide/nickel transport system substrate-binding protein